MKRPRHLDRPGAGVFVQRIARLRADSSRLWGTMTPAAVAAHLRRSIEISLGEVPVRDRSNWFLRVIGRRLAFEVFPIPRGRIKAPAYFFPPDTGAFEQERAALLAKIDEFVSALEAEPARLQVSEYFGPLPLSYWALIHAAHMDHHLRQFGV